MKAKRKTMKDKVLEMHTANPKMSAVEIAKALNIKTAYVHQIKYLERKNGSTAKAKKVPKAKAKKSVSQPVNPLPSLLDNLRTEVANLNMVIHYLERRAGV
jgi:hypothetical protein